jgi:thiopeptide-type bacteriocin biosynthesis protein
MLSSYKFDPRLIVRIPTLPMPQHPGQVDCQSLVKDELFLEAIYLASPVLYNECLKWRDGLITNKKDDDKIVRSITKYYLRMSSRCTPFGLFSGCALTGWSDDQQSAVLASDALRRYTRLDMYYLCALADWLTQCPFIREKLRFMPNNSLYVIGNEIRYVEYFNVDDSRRHRISSVTTTECLTGILEFATPGKSIPEMVEFLGGHGIDAADALAFINEIIDCQLLASEFLPSITGGDFMDQIVSVLENLEPAADPRIGQIIQVLHEVGALVRQRNADTKGAGISVYKRITNLLQHFGVSFSEGRLFQTDLFRNLSGNGVPSTCQQQLREALQVLNKLAILRDDTPLQLFARRFSQRYENKEMPLQEVLDAEIGIGYEENGADCMSPLVEDLHFTDLPGKSKMDWSNLEVCLNAGLMETVEGNGYILRLTDKQLEKFPSEENDLPPSIPVMFRVVEQDSLYIESSGGSSAVNLLARFSHADAGIGQLARDITDHEQAQDPDVFYADIVHLPESRTGNIMLHPGLRSYEIPYLASSSLDKECQIAVQDLYVSVRNGKVILRSGRLNRRVIPRLSTAHNYTLSALPVYRFLCDLQLQDKKSSLSFNWGSLRHQHRFLPRVMYKNTILHAASWNLGQEDIAVLAGLCGEPSVTALEQFRSKWKMPRFVVLSEGDNELLIDLDCTRSVQLWLESVRNKDRFLLKEFLRPAKMVADEQQAIYANQFIAVLTRQGMSYPEVQLPPTLQSSTAGEQREFSLGTEWVYFKLYCGVRSADRILTDAITPMVGQLMDKDLIDKWFFIRYKDPEFNLRLRFHLKNVADIGSLITIVHDHLRQFESGGYIWKVQTDTYKREMERYGSHSIAMAESFFHYDSVACLQFILCTAGDERETIRWIWALRAIDELLDCFSLSIETKLSLMQHLRNSFGQEFNVDKQIRTRLNDKYRDSKKMIDSIMTSDLGSLSDWKPLIDILKDKSACLQTVSSGILTLHNSGRLEISLRDLLGSFCHMMLNRIITTEARTHELVIYDFMCRYYKSRMSRDNSAKCADTDSLENPALVLSNN